MKRLIFAFGLLVVLVVVGVIVVQRLMLPKFSAQWLVTEIEGAYPCRAHVGEVEVSLTTRPAVLRIKDVMMVPRDGVADAGTPLAERTRPELGSTGLLCEEATVEANLEQLLAGKIDVSGIVATGVHVKTVVSGKGESSIDVLFESGDDGGEEQKSEGAKDGGGGGENPPKAEVVKAGDREHQAEGERFHVGDLPLPATLAKLAIEDSRVDCFLEKPKAMLSVLDLNAALLDLDVDAADLANHNKAKMDGSARLTLTNRDGDLKFLELLLGATGDIVPFDPEDGFLNPDTVYEFAIKQGSTIDVLPMIDELTKNLGLLEGVGVNLDRLKLRGELKRDVPVRLRFFDSKILAADEVALVFKDYALTMDEGSWLRTVDSTHLFDGGVVGSEGLTEDVVGAIDKYLGEKAGDSVASIAKGLVVDPMLVDGRLTVRYHSEGKLGRPRVRGETPVKSLEEALEAAMKNGGIQDLLKGFADKLFGK